MDAVLLGVALLLTAAIVWAGVYFTFRGFRALDRPPVEKKPRHDAATTARLKQFFEGKQCAVCKKPIPPVHAFELRPGLMNPTTHDAIAWDDIPPASVSTLLESHVPICSNCVLVEKMRQKHPERVVDRHRTVEEYTSR
jgi:hypothetical protein